MKYLCLISKLAVALLWMGWAVGVQAESESQSTIESMKVSLYKSHIVSLNRPIKKISVGNPNIADILVMQATEVYVLGKALGTTNVLLWDASGNLVKAFDVEVTHDLRMLREKLHDLLPAEKIDVTTSQGAIVLNGHVSNATAMNTAYQIAQSFSKQDVAIKKDDEGGDDQEEGLGVINLLQVGDSQQVMLKVTVAEMQRSLVRKWDMQFKNLFINSAKVALGGVNGGATFPDGIFKPEDAEIPVMPGSGVNSGMWGPAVSEIQASNMPIADKGFFGSYLDDNFFFMFSLDAAKNTGLAKILAEPTLTTLTGQDAAFLSGGEFPIPVADDNGIKVDYKEFGVGVKFLPTVLANDRIHLDLNITVSEVNSANSIFVNAGEAGSTYVLPSLSKRSARSRVELANGQSIAIAGLMNENMRDLVNKFPLLGDLPIIGALFRSKDFQKGETELVILVTPQLVKPVDRNEIVLPTDGYVEPSDLQFYLLGKGVYRDKNIIKQKAQTYSSVAPLTQPSSPAADAVSSGRFGHVLDENEAGQ